MKRTLLLACSMLILSGGAFALPAPDPAELAALRAAIFTPQPIQVSESADGTCYVSNDCNGAGTISCSSPYGNCHSGYDWVECDGNRQYCSTGNYYCETPCPNGGSVSCTGSSWCSSNYNCWVECDGQRYTCYRTPWDPVCAE